MNEHPRNELSRARQEHGRMRHTTCTVMYHLPGRLSLLAEIWYQSRQACIKSSEIMRITYSMTFPLHGPPYLVDLGLSQFHTRPPSEQCMISGAKGMNLKSMVHLCA